MLSTIIFDFDGVILESVSVKTEAFRTLFSFAPENQEEIVKFHIKNGGISRYDKIRYIYSNILHKDLSDEQFNTMSDRFADLVFNNVIHSPFVPGAKEFIKKNYHKYFLFVVSATPEDELRQIIDIIGLTQYFKGIYGAPEKKVDHINAILTMTNSKKENTIFVGDALNDCKAAESSGIRFVGRVLPGEPDYFTGSPEVEYTIRTFYDLEKYISFQAD